ncbi:MAG: type I DNA topoisomerase [Bacteroidales bacterium]|jgi:DNA topoisomerase-1|nr:type I DNA topoisomerase [Bacteroidales bacterium]
MSKNLVIVESPAKAKTIEKFLGKDYKVKSSMGHVRDLPEKKLGVDITNNFAPLYEVLHGKNKIINELKEDVKKVDVVWLATDEDREGEAISWHLKEVLNLPDSMTRRIAFHEITKPSVIHAIENPRELDINLVDAQQARRVLDRLVGFELSPLLWKKVQPALSAGRVQSVAVRLIVEREKEIQKFQSVSTYRVLAEFLVVKGAEKTVAIRAELNTRFKTEEEAKEFLENCKGAAYTVNSVEKHPAKKSPSAPFTTSTLQQEASRKLGFSVSKTMIVAQQLYESGYITYMRTDSVNLSDLALADAKNEITQYYGAEYSKTRKYVTKTKGAQEAHEAIRPSYLEQHTINTGDNAQKRLYELIWKRTIASQMSDAKFEKTTVSIDISTRPEKFITEGEVLLFDGFLKVYMESHDDEENNEDRAGELPPIKEGMVLPVVEIQSIEKFSQQPYRYTEASLVRKLEELGIGRPSTYAPTISTIQKRQYVLKGEREGIERTYNVFTLKQDKITQSTKKEKVGQEKGKLYPTDVGVVVNDFLIVHFENIMNYNFTAKVEKEFDNIADGKRKWEDMIREFYVKFHKIVEVTMKTSEKAVGERLLGKDTKTDRNVYAKLARFGPVIQIGESDEKVKPLYAKLMPNQSIETITLEEALDLFKLPRVVGSREGEELVVNIGPYGPYIRYRDKFYSVSKTEDLKTITIERCMELIDQKIESDAQKAPVLVGQYNNMDVSAAVGRYGPYLSYNKRFYSLPADTNVKALSLDEAVEAIKNAEKKNTIQSFEENDKIKVLKGKYGAYITDGKDNYKVPKGKNPTELTCQECLDIIKQNQTDKPEKKKTVRKKK